MNLNTQIRVQQIQIEDAQGHIKAARKFLDSADPITDAKDIEQAKDAIKSLMHEIGVCREVVATLEAQKGA